MDNPILLVGLLCVVPGGVLAATFYAGVWWGRNYTIKKRVVVVEEEEI